MADPLIRHFFGGFVRLHILYHAAKEPIYGVEMMKELQRHGYKLGPGTLYPILHQLHTSGFLTCKQSIVSGKRRKNYRITAKGRRVLIQSQAKLKELISEIVKDHDKMALARKK
jgi:PadR family transcriptional regulator PadR